MKRLVVFAFFVVLGLFFNVVTFAQDQQERPARPTVEQSIENWMRMDADSNGTISEDEAQGLMKSNFSRVDENSDGAIDREELVHLAGRLRGQQNGARQQPNRPQQGMSTEQVLERVPEGVRVVPDIAYREGDSRAWRLDLVMPEEASYELRPGIVFVHGGGWRSGDKRAGTFLNGAFEYAQKGYVCITINYRLTGEAPFPACIEDVKCAVRWFRANSEKYGLDPERLGGYGNSAGAHLVAVLGLVGPDAELEGDGPHQDQSSMIQAVCCSATPTDFTLFGARAGGDHTGAGGISAESQEALRERLLKYSPISYVDEDAPPFLVIHGTADRTVDIAHGDQFVEKLEEVGAEDVTYIRVDGAGHGVYGFPAAQAKPAMEAFFDRTLRGE
jgi:acetyl esterase/lipase